MNDYIGLKLKKDRTITSIEIWQAYIIGVEDVLTKRMGVS